MSALKNLLRWSPASAGRIKIGVNKKANNKMGKLPTKIQGMLIVKDRKDDENLNFIPDVNAHKILKSITDDGKPKPIYSIPIKFDSDNIENFLFVRKASYQGKTCVCSYDGSNDGNSNEMIAVDSNGELKKCSQCPKNNPQYNGNDKCKVNVSLYVKIVGVTPLGKYHVFKTTGWNSTQALGNSIMSLWKEGIGRLRGPIFHLTYGEKTTVDVSGATRKVPILSVEFNGNEDELHAKIIETANKEAKYMSDMTAINGLKLNNSQELFIDYSDVEEFYPESQALPEPKQQVESIETEYEEEDSFKQFNPVQEDTITTEDTPTEKPANPSREDLVKELCQNLGWTEEQLKGKRVSTLKGYLADGVMPPPEAKAEPVEEIQQQEAPQENTEAENDIDDIPDFVPGQEDDAWKNI